MLDANWIQCFNTRVLDLPNRDRWTIEEDDELTTSEAPYGWFSYITSSFGRFRCSTCQNPWPSAKVPILFQLQLSGAAGRVKVRFFKQRCRKSHDGAEYEEPGFREEDMSPVLDRLMIKIRQRCYHQNVQPNHHGGQHGDQDRPHEREHCQGCAMGICRREN